MKDETHCKEAHSCRWQWTRYPRKEEGRDDIIVGQKEEGKAYILRGAHDNLLGKPEIKTFGLVKTIRTITQTIKSDRAKFCNGLGELPDVFRIHIKEESVLYQPAYTCPGICQ